MSENSENGVEMQGVPTRRRMLMLGAASVSAVVTIRPALANTTASVLNCEIPVPDSGNNGKFLAPDGTLVDPNTPGAIRPPARPLKGEDVRKVMTGGQSTYPGATYEQSQAYTQYVSKLHRGQAGFTCFNSIQLPNR